MPGVWMMLACVAAAVDPAPPSPPAPVEVVADEPPPPPVPSMPSVVAEARIEGPSTPGECRADSECVATGCASEVCVAGARAGEIITTCEVLPIFSELSACGCHEGVCSWTRVPGARELGAPRTLPVRVIGGGY